MIRLPQLALGDLETEVLDLLWRTGPAAPGAVHEAIGVARGISLNTVASALKRLHEKGLLEREKVSHAYLYRPALSRGEFQRACISAIAEQFADGKSQGLLAAFVDVAAERGETSLRTLEALISARLGEDGE